MCHLAITSLKPYLESDDLWYQLPKIVCLKCCGIQSPSLCLSLFQVVFISSCQTAVSLPASSIWFVAETHKHTPAHTHTFTVHATLESCGKEGCVCDNITQ